MKKETIFEITGVISIIMILVFLIAKLSYGYMIMLQGYIDISIIRILFWVLLLIIFLIILTKDVGFIKLGAILGVFVCFYSLVSLYILNDTNFEIVSDDKYDLVIEFVDSPELRYIVVYQKQDLLFSKYVEQVTLGKHYDISYEINEDKFVITKCTEISCQTEEIDLLE
jgi:hypothetical protein